MATSVAPVFVVHEEHVLPAGAAVERAEDTALAALAEDVAEGGDEDDVGIGRVDGDASDLLRLDESHGCPGLPRIARLVDAVTLGEVASHAGLAHAGVDDVGVRLGDGERADRAGPEVAVRHRQPGDAAVLGLPDTAARGAEVVDVGLAGDAGDGGDATAAVRSDAAPPERGKSRLGRSRLLFLGVWPPRSRQRH